MSTKERILCALKSAGASYVSGQELAKQLSISRAAVWKHIKALCEKGYIIERLPRRGYLLTSSPDLLFPAEIQHDLDTDGFGQVIHYFPKIDSTNNRAKELAIAGAPEGTLVVAEEQTGGRGRVGRAWFSPPGGIWFSLIIRPLIAPSEVLKITLMAGVAGTNAIFAATGLKPRIKWPNDILIGGKKVAGILTEMETEADRVHFAVLGMGINANIKAGDFDCKLRKSATSLSAILGKKVDRKKMIKLLLRELESGCAKLKSKDFASVLDSWKEWSDTLGSRVKIISGVSESIEGEAVDISDQGALVVKLASGERINVWSGHVINLRPLR